APRTLESHSLSLHDALPISISGPAAKEAIAPSRLDSASAPPWAEAREGPCTAALNSAEAVTFMNDQPSPSRTREVMIPEVVPETDRKSTRLNSSHVSISYAV